MKKVSNIVDLMAEIYKSEVDVVAIYGPSASGKSTISKNLVEALFHKGYSVPGINNAPIPLSVDDFYKNNTRQIAKGLGGNFDHPFLIDHEEAAESVDKLLKYGKAKIPIYSFKEGKRVGEQVIEMIGNGRRIVVAEGIYSFALKPILEERGYRVLTVEVTTSSPLELIARRILRDLERTDIQDPIIQMDLSMKALATNKMYMYKIVSPDVLYINDWSILEKVGEKTYQIKVPKEEIKGIVNHLQPEKVYFEDLVIRQNDEQLRLRIFWDREELTPKYAILSYRKREGETVKTWKIEVSPLVYSAFILLSYILLGAPPERYTRDITTAREVNLYRLDINGKKVVIKEYVDKNYAEIETSDEEILESIKRIVRKYSVSSYYDS